MPFHVRILAGRIDRRAGSHAYHLELTRRLADRGHRVSLVCFGQAPDVADCAEVFSIPEPAHRKLPFLWRFDALRNYLHYAGHLRRLALPAADVVVGGEHFFLKGHHRKFPHTPWIYLPHSLVVDQEILSYGLPGLMHRVTAGLYVGLQRWALNHADRTLRFTHLACTALDQRYGKSVRPRYTVNPPATTLPEGLPDRPGDSPVRLLWVGQLIPRKRIHVALNALGGLAHLDWRFDVVGDGVCRQELEQQTRELGLTGRVQFHGFQPDPFRWYRQAHLLLFPSWLESFGLILLEAMAHAVPCLAMRSDGVRFHNVNTEVIEHGLDGFLARDDDDFGQQLQHLVQEPARLRAAGEAARQTITQRFTWDRHLDQMEQLFAELVGSGQKKVLTVA